MGLFEVLDDLRGNRVTINNKNNRSTSLSHRRRSEFESAGADWNMRGCRHRNAKI